MAAVLLREYVTLLIEKIRTEKNQKGKMGERFNIQKFKSLPGNEAMMHYAAQFLERLGHGSSRMAFLLSSKYVLKIAMNKAGLGQNQAEVEVYTNPKSKPVVAKVYQGADDDSWLISDLVRPIKSADEFSKLTGIDWGDFRTYVKIGVSNKGEGSVEKVPPLVSALLTTMKSNQLKAGDIIGTNEDGGQDKISAWGQTPDGRVVLLDYGLTDDVWSDHYVQKQMPQAKSAASSDKTSKPGEAPDTDKVDSDKTRITHPDKDPEAIRATHTAKTHTGRSVPKQNHVSATLPAKSRPDVGRNDKTAAPKRYQPSDDELHRDQKTAAAGRTRR